MNTTVKLLVSFFALVVVLFLIVQYGGHSLVQDIAGQDQGEAAQSTELVGSRAPFFDLPDVAGDHVKISDFSDTPIVLVFWASWNQEATDQIKILDDYLSKEADAHFAEIIAISSQEEMSAVSSFMRRGGYAVKTLVDARGATSEAYDIKGLPTSIFIDRDGTVRSRYTGALSKKALSSEIEKLQHVY